MSLSGRKSTHSAEPDTDCLAIPLVRENSASLSRSTETQVFVVVSTSYAGIADSSDFATDEPDEMQLTLAPPKPPCRRPRQ